MNRKIKRTGLAVLITAASVAVSAAMYYFVSRHFLEVGGTAIESLGRGDLAGFLVAEVTSVAMFATGPLLGLATLLLLGNVLSPRYRRNTRRALRATKAT